jgi:hypothetical protein
VGGHGNFTEAHPDVWHMLRLFETIGFIGAITSAVFIIALGCANVFFAARYSRVSQYRRAVVVCACIVVASYAVWLVPSGMRVIVELFQLMR